MNKMSQNIDWKEIERKAYRDVQQDGLGEFLIGIGMVLVAGIILTPTFLKGLFYIPILLSSRIGEALRRRFTYPRIGYAKLQSEDPKKTVGGIFLIIFVLLAIMALVLTLFGDVRDFTLWMKWFPAFCGTLLVGLFLDLADKSGTGRHYVFALLSVISGFSFSLIPFNEMMMGLTMYFLSMGAVMIITGFVLFLWFLHKNPLPAEELQLEEAIDAN